VEYKKSFSVTVVITPNETVILDTTGLCNKYWCPHISVIFCDMLVSYSDGFVGLHNQLLS